MRFTNKAVYIFVFVKYLAIISTVVAQTEVWIQTGNDIYGNQGDASGWSVALNALVNVVAIGEPYNDNGNGISAGRLRVYERNATATNTWIQRGQNIYGDAENDYAAGGWFVSIRQ